MPNNATPLVSVITAFLNEERFLTEAIESVMAQTYSNWELILIDDGSTDRSTQIAKDYAQAQAGKIMYVEHEGHANRSTAASRNLGISVAKGELVAFLDADDVWDPVKLQSQVQIMQAHPRVNMLLEASNYWNSWENASAQDIIIQVGNERDRVFEHPELAETIYPLAKAAAPCPSAIMVRREALIRLGGFESSFTGKYQLYEDQAFLMKWYLSEHIYISSLCNNKYRQRSGSCVNWVHKEGSYHTVRQYFLDWMGDYMRRHNIRYDKVQRLHKKALDQYNRPVIYFMRKNLSKVQRKLSLLR